MPDTKARNLTNNEFAEVNIETVIGWNAAPPERRFPFLFDKGITYIGKCQSDSWMTQSAVRAYFGSGRLADNRSPKQSE